MGNKDKKERETSFWVDSENGLIKKMPDDSRVFAVDSLGWAKLQHELTSTFVSGAAVILQRMGYSYGRHLGRVAKLHGATQIDVLDRLIQYSKEEGWGKLSLNSGDMSIGDARLVVKGCFFCLHWKDSTVPVCHILEGLVGGITDEVTGRTHRVLEERCVAKGDTVCEIIVERLS